MKQQQSTSAGSGTVRLTMAQALVRHLCALEVESDDGTRQPYCAGVWAVFGHGNVAGLGEALYAHRDALPVAVVSVAGCHGAVHDLDQPLILVICVYTRVFCRRIPIVIISIRFAVGAG